MIDAGQVILSESVPTIEAGRDELEGLSRGERAMFPISTPVSSRRYG